MKIKIWVATNSVGSEIEDIVEIDDEELEGMTEKEREEYINEEYYKPWVWENIEASWNEVDE